MKHLLYLLLICFALSSSSCKRDYPSDIPGWLKDRILSLKRTGKSHPFVTCMDGQSLRIYEYRVKSTGDIVYRFSQTYGYTYLDAQGNNLCNTYMGSPSCSSCICSSGGMDVTMLRTVWEASHCH